MKWRPQCQSKLQQVIRSKSGLQIAEVEETVNVRLFAGAILKKSIKQRRKIPAGGGGLGRHIPLLTLLGLSIGDVATDAYSERCVVVLGHQDAVTAVLHRI